MEEEEEGVCGCSVEECGGREGELCVYGGSCSPSSLSGNSLSVATKHDTAHSIW